MYFEEKDTVFLRVGYSTDINLSVKSQDFTIQTLSSLMVISWKRSLLTKIKNTASIKEKYVILIIYSTIQFSNN